MRKRFYTLIVLLFLTITSYGQNWGGGVDDENVHFGFNFSYVGAEYKIFKKASWREPFYDPETSALVRDSLYSISSSVNPGFGLGFVANLRLGNNADFRITPSLIFTDRLLKYAYADNNPDTEIEKKVQSTMVDLPLGFKLKSDRRGNFRAYLLGGAKYSIDIISKKKTDDSQLVLAEKLVKNKRGFLSYEAGIGLDLYFEFFKLSPEIKLSNSIGNVLDRGKEAHPYSAPVDKLFLRNLQFSLYFE